MKALRTHMMVYPLALLAAFYITWIAGRLTLGHWPRPSLDDPKNIGGLVDAPYNLTVALLLIGLPVFASLLFALLCAAFASPERLQRKELLITSGKSVASLAAVIGLLLLDPFGVSAWFMD